MNRGDEVGVVILGIDKDNRRISLGHKQVQPDPWPDLQKQFSVATETIGVVSRLLDRGAIVDLPGEVEGFVPTNQLGKKDINRPADAFNEGDELPLKVIEFDSHNRRIILSVDAYLNGRQDADIAAYLAKHPTKVMPVADMVDGAGARHPAGKAERSEESKSIDSGRQQAESRAEESKADTENPEAPPTAD